MFILQTSHQLLEKMKLAHISRLKEHSPTFPIFQNFTKKKSPYFSCLHAHKVVCKMKISEFLKKEQVIKQYKSYVNQCQQNCCCFKMWAIKCNKNMERRKKLYTVISYMGQMDANLWCILTSLLDHHCQVPSQRL